MLVTPLPSPCIAAAAFICNFIWSIQGNAPRYHWVSWKTLFMPKAEGGFGLRRLEDLTQAYSCKLWWSYHNKDSLWTAFLSSKYGHRQHYIPCITDTVTWKRICSVHDLCSPHAVGQLRSRTWTLESNGQFTIKSAYELLRSSGPKYLSHWFIWHRLQQPNNQIILWKLYHHALPIEDNLRRFTAICPTCCPFCHNSSATQAHLFLKCTYIQQIWKYYASIVDGPQPGNMHLFQYLVSWWTSTSAKSFQGVLRLIVPGIVVWQIWKAYSAMIFGGEQYHSDQLKESIRRHIYTWSCAQHGRKFVTNEHDLILFGLTPRMRLRRPQIVRWRTPPPGRLKLNVDAAHGSITASGGAILRDIEGNLKEAIVFYLPLSSPFQAELQAASMALLYFLQRYRQLDMELDSKGVVEYLHSESVSPLLHSLIIHGNVMVSHIPRQANEVAHLLAQFGQLHQQFHHFCTLSMLPPMVKGALLTDVSTPHIRI